MDNRFKLARTKYNRHGPESVKNVAKNASVTGSLIDDLESNVGKPRDVGYLKIRKLAVYYGVTSDFLLGLSGTPSVKEDIQVVCKTTGLTEKAIEAIKASGSWYVDVLNSFLENPDFFSFLREVHRLATAKYKLKVAENDLATVDDGYEEKIRNLTEKRIVQEYWIVEKYKELQNSTIDNLFTRECKE